MDTPEKYEQLKQGHFDNKYSYVKVSAGAHPDVLLQPQYLVNASFQALSFIAKADGNEDVVNMIVIYPNVSYADAFYVDGENPLSGIPTTYSEYRVFYQQPAKPTAENINSILHFAQAKKLSVNDRNGVALDLYKRIEDLSKFKQLRVLNLCIQKATYKELKVAAFMENLISLREITFVGNDMSDEQVKEFYSMNVIPSNWRGWLIGRSIQYTNKNEEMV